MPTRIWPIVVAVVVAAVVLLGAWYFLGLGGGTGTLAVKVHDAPCTGCAHVWVTFSSVAVHESDVGGSGWTTLNVSGTTVDLMALNGSALAKTLGVGTLKAGHYEQIRLDLTTVVVGLTGGTNLTARLPNASTGDVTGAFDVHSGSTTTISVDIDLASSLHVEGTGPGLSAVFTPHIGSVVVV